MAAGAGLRVCARGSSWFGVVVVCGRLLVAVVAGGLVPGCGSGGGWWWALSWCVVCGISGDGDSEGGGVVRTLRGAVSLLC